MKSGFVRRPCRNVLSLILQISVRVFGCPDQYTPRSLILQALSQSTRSLEYTAPKHYEHYNDFKFLYLDS